MRSTKMTAISESRDAMSLNVEQDLRSQLQEFARLHHTDASAWKVRLLPRGFQVWGLEAPQQAAALGDHLGVRMGCQPQVKRTPDGSGWTVVWGG
jgi:hypothetical protein